MTLSLQPAILKSMNKTYVLDEQLIGAARKEGFENGLTWPDIWESHGTPGGPFVCGDFHTYAHAQSAAENKAWREGWAVGHAEKLAQGRSNPPRK